MLTNITPHPSRRPNSSRTAIGLSHRYHISHVYYLYISGLAISEEDDEKDKASLMLLGR